MPDRQRQQAGGWGQEGQPTFDPKDTQGVAPGTQHLEAGAAGPKDKLK